MGWVIAAGKNLHLGWNEWECMVLLPARAAAQKASLPWPAPPPTHSSWGV